jgi:putative ABC transport system permease protein
MAAGRSFSVDFSTDSAAFVMNETAFRLMNQELTEPFASPDEAIGKEIRLGFQGGRTGPLVGVVKDFNMSSLHEAIEPIMFFIYPDWYNNYVVRVQPGNFAATLEAVETTWRQFYADWPFEYQFADQGFDAQYRAEERLGQIFTVFAVLAIFIACLGLFGLASFTAQQRTKEIGVRKVFGASVGSIIVLLSTDFARLVGVAFVVAVPVAYLAMNRWLQDFAYRIDISWTTFLIAGLAAFGIALLTVSYQSIKSALVNPVKSLRYE